MKLRCQLFEVKYSFESSVFPTFVLHILHFCFVFLLCKELLSSLCRPCHSILNTFNSSENFTKSSTGLITSDNYNHKIWLIQVAGSCEGSAAVDELLCPIFHFKQEKARSNSSDLRMLRGERCSLHNIIMSLCCLPVLS